jgi:PAS domain S-box-containing protein
MPRSRITIDARQPILRAMPCLDGILNGSWSLMGSAFRPGLPESLPRLSAGFRLRRTSCRLTGDDGSSVLQFFISTRELAAPRDGPIGHPARRMRWHVQISSAAWSQSPERIRSTMPIRPSRFSKLLGYRNRGLPILTFALTLAVLLGGGFLGVISAQRLIANYRQVGHTDEAMLAVETLLSTLENAETSQRGYLLTGNDAYLQAYSVATERLPAELSRLKTLVTDPRQRARVASLERSIDLKLDDLKQSVALEKAANHDIVATIMRTNVGEARMDAIRTQVAAIQAAERELLAHRAAQTESSTRATLVTIIVPALIGAGLLGLVFYLSRRNLRLERSAAASASDERERLRITLASIGDAVLSTDSDCRITFANPVAESITGWSSAEMLGQPLEAVFRILSEQTRAALDNPAARALRERTIVGGSSNTLLVRKDGTERPIDDNAAPILDARGCLIGCVLVFRDIAERKRSDRQIHDLVNALKEADRHKDEFLAFLAHELRGPLTPLRNSVEILKQAGADEGIRLQVQATMERQLGQLARLVADLLDVSRIARGQIELRRESVDLGRIVQQAVETCRPLIDSAQHTLDVSVTCESPRVDADPARLTQVLSNLLHNACKYTEPGGRIELALTRDREEAVIRVKDSGIGIPANKLEGVFDLFVQLDHSPERSQGGLGVGLAVVKRLVKMHGGSVEASSEGPGRGSEFVVRLPVESRERLLETDVPEAEIVPARRASK